MKIKEAVILEAVHTCNLKVYLLWNKIKNKIIKHIILCNIKLWT